MICQRMAVIRKKGCIDVKSYWKELRSEFAGYNAAKFAKDLMAGVTVAAVALPLALAFGVGSGASAASGLLTAVICGFVISLLGGAFYQISGPTGAMAAILMSIAAQYGMSGVFAATVFWRYSGYSRHCAYQRRHEVRGADAPDRHDSCGGFAGVDAAACSCYGANSFERFGGRFDGNGLAHERMENHSLSIQPPL